MFRSIAVILGMSLATGTANAALESRDGGLAYYDTVLNITWQANANLAATNTFGVSGIGFNGPGTMTWDTAESWITAMNANVYLGLNIWRLPRVAPINGSSFTFAPGLPYSYSYDGSTDLGYNVSAPGSPYPNATGSEMANLFYNTLGNRGQFNTSGNLTGCSVVFPYCITNAGPFSNIQSYYWSGTEFAPDPLGAWEFHFAYGIQGAPNKALPDYAWAVALGDPLAVAIPPAAFLFPSALGLLGWVRRASTV